MFEHLARGLSAFAEKDGRGYPDWAIRYVPLVKHLERSASLKGKRVLEIGANENGLARFADVRVIATDRDVTHLKAATKQGKVLPIAADIRALPFPAHVFDVCVCADTLEHLPTKDHEGACAEIGRVLDTVGTAVICFPSGEGAQRAETRIRKAYARYTGGTLRWLEEHALAELPDDKIVAALMQSLAANTHRVRCAKNATLWVWDWMWSVLMCGWPGRGNAVFQALLRLLTPVLCHVHWGTCYRAVVWVEPRES